MIAKADIRRVQEWMGHADIQTTMRYLHYAPRDEDAAWSPRRSRSSRRRSAGTSWDVSGRLARRPKKWLRRPAGVHAVSCGISLVPSTLAARSLTTGLRLAVARARASFAAFRRCGAASETGDVLGRLGPQALSAWSVCLSGMLVFACAGRPAWMKRTDREFVVNAGHLLMR